MGSSSDNQSALILAEIMPLLSLEPEALKIDSNELKLATKALRALDNYREHYTENELKDKLFSIVSEALGTKHSVDERRAFLKEKLSHLASDLSYRIGRWRIVVPIDNLTVSKNRKFRMGSVTFSRFSKKRHRDLTASLKAYLSQHPRFAGNTLAIDNYIKHERKLILDSLIDKTCADTEVLGRSNHAYRDALFRIEEAVACIKLFRYQNDDLYGRYFGIPGNVVRAVRRDHLLYPATTGFLGCGWERVGYSFEFEINNERLKFMKALGYEKISGILEKEKRTDLEERIVSSVLWFARASDVALVRKTDKNGLTSALGKRKADKKAQTEMMAPYDRLLKLFVSLETLLLFDRNEPIISNLTERIAFLVGKDYNARKCLIKFLKRMYGYRSAIIHHGGKPVPRDELEKMMYLTQNVIVKVIKDFAVPRMRTVESFREWFEMRKFR